MLPHVARFEAPWEPQLKVATAVLVGLLIFVGLGVPLLGLALSGPSLELVYPFAIPLIVVSIALVVTWALAPRGYSLDSDTLTVERLLSPVRIPFSSIRAVAPVSDGLRGSIRLGGNGGLFGYYGRYWSRQLGSFRLYATRRTDLVRVDTDDEVFIVSPSAVPRFVDAVRHRAPNAAADFRSVEPRSLKLSGRRALRTVALIVGGVAVLVGGLFAAMQGFAPRSIAVVGDVVRVDRRWASPIDLPLAQIHKVELMDPQYGKRWWRTNGTAIGPVRYGRFGSRELGAFRLFAYREGPYVLLETDDGRVVVTPDDPAGFVSDVSRALR